MGDAWGKWSNYCYKQIRPFRCNNLLSLPSTLNKYMNVYHYVFTILCSI